MRQKLEALAERQRRFWTVRRISWLLTALYLASLIPMLAIAWYNYAGADDFSIGETAHAAWLESHSIFAVLWQAVKMAAHDYMTWMGYYSAIFMMSIHPGVFGEHVYALTTWIMVGMLSGGTVYFLRALLVKALGAPRALCRCVAMLLLFVTVQCAVGRNEAFYWYCGAVNYIFFYAVGLFFLGALLSLAFDRGRKKRMYDVALACFLGLFVGGGNYMTALSVAIVLAAGFVLLAKNGTLRRHRALLLPSALFFLGFLASCFAPGNSYRSSITQGMSAVKAVLISLYYFFDYCVSDWTTWAVFALFLLMVPFVWKMVKSTRFSFPCPLLFFLFAYGLVSANITPPLFAMGNIGAGRLQAVIFMQYLLLMTLCLIYGLGWLARYTERRASDKAERSTCLSRPAFAATVLLAAFFVYASALCVAVDPHFYTGTSAAADLLNGSAAAYGRAQAERAQVLNDKSVRDVVFEKLPAEPKLLFYADLTDTMESWENKAAARYYGKDSVVVKRE